MAEVHLDIRFDTGYARRPSTPEMTEVVDLINRASPPTLSQWLYHRYRQEREQQAAAELPFLIRCIERQRRGFPC